MFLRTEILSYIDEKGEDGSSWSDLEIRFVSKEQLLESLQKRSQGKGKSSKGAFVNVIKELQRGEDPCVKKVLIKGKPRYVITIRGKSELGKQNLTQGLKNQDLIETELPSQIIFNLFFDKIKKQVDVIRQSSWNPFDKLKGKKGEFYGNFYADLYANLYSKYIKLNTLHPKGKKAPNLNVVFERKKDNQGLNGLLTYFISVAGEYEKETGNMLPFQILLTYDPPNISHEYLLKQVNETTDTLYKKWLIKFNQRASGPKKDEFAEEMLEYFKLIHQIRLEKLQLI